MHTFVSSRSMTHFRLYSVSKRLTLPPLYSVGHVIKQSYTESIIDSLQENVSLIGIWTFWPSTLV